MPPDEGREAVADRRGERLRGGGAGGAGVGGELREQRQGVGHPGRVDPGQRPEPPLRCGRLQGRVRRGAAHGLRGGRRGAGTGPATRALTCGVTTVTLTVTRTVTRAGAAGHGRRDARRGALLHDGPHGDGRAEHRAHPRRPPHGGQTAPAEGHDVVRRPDLAVLRQGAVLDEHATQRRRRERHRQRSRRGGRGGRGGRDGGSGGGTGAGAGRSAAPSRPEQVGHGPAVRLPRRTGRQRVEDEDLRGHERRAGRPRPVARRPRLQGAPHVLRRTGGVVPDPVTARQSRPSTTTATAAPTPARAVRRGDLRRVDAHAVDLRLVVRAPEDDHGTVTVAGPARTPPREVTRAVPPATTRRGDEPRRGERRVAGVPVRDVAGDVQLPVTPSATGARSGPRTAAVTCGNASPTGTGPPARSTSGSTTVDRHTWVSVGP